MRNYGLVRAIEGKFVEVVIPKGGECKNCGACIVYASDHTSVVRAINPVGAKIGDRVEIEIHPRDVVFGAFFVFIFPLLVGALSGLMGFLIGRRIEHAYLIAAVLGAIGLLSSFLIVGLISRRRVIGVYATVVEVVDRGE
ncbi:MAG: SoxR reducing system RseC family protein [bacterium]